ncbi:hypothetical protein HGO37_05900 [Rhizobium sp. CG4]|jgi:hypothetical protein|uniref:hypothetical protein n=1 Tax=Rhizobium sp. CG4 TaxID=2726075 RepID=UPI0020332B0B|nr:hypothetical protein [Rhizobium sp. CG4]MCM2454917.1 hypothetical protein [Rhizobium sp. CG4]
MTIPSEVNRSGPYNGNGVTTAFEYQFKIYEPEHLRVILIDTDGSETVLNHQHDFIVTGVADDSGGNAVLNVAPVNGQKIVLLRGVPFTQDTDLENQGAYYAETVEVRMDLLTMQIQQLKEQTDRSILADYGQSGLKIANNLDEGDTLMMVGGLLGKGPNSGMIVNAAGYATQAYQARDAAQGHAQDAETSAVETASSAATAAQWSARAQDWAVKLDGVVDGTEHSAKYWANQAYLNGGVPIGTIIDVYGNGTTIPPGYLKIIPGLEITTAYPELRTWALANGWSVNGAGNPVFPATDDALFKRQWRASQTLRDAGRVFGSVQADALQDHRHAMPTSGQSPWAIFGIKNVVSSVVAGFGSTATTTTIAYTDSPDGRMASETRPANITVTWFIKAYDAPFDKATLDATQLVNDVADARTRVATLETTKGWELVDDTGELTNVAAYTRTGLDAFRQIRISGILRPSSNNAVPCLIFSPDNGGTWINSSYYISASGMVGVSAGYDAGTSGVGAMTPSYRGLSNTYDMNFEGMIFEFNKAKAQSKYYKGQAVGVDSGNAYFSLLVGGAHSTSAALNGLRIYMSSGNFTGRLLVEGRRG